MSANLDMDSRKNVLAVPKSRSAFHRCATVDLPAASWVAAVVALIICLLYFNTIAFMVETWAHSETYQHGFIIPLIVIFLIWRKRRELTGLCPEPSLWGVASLLSCSLLWGLGYLARVHVVQQYAVVGMFPSTVWAILGSRVVRELKFPLAYLFFAVPAGEVFVPYLRAFTAHFTVEALHWSGVPVYSDGYAISIPAGNFIVARACSGIRYTIASLALGAIFAYLTYVSYWKRALFVLFSALVPILANGLRAYGILMIAQFIDVKYAHGIDHLIYGWIFFGFVVLLMFWAGGLFRDEAAVSNSPAAPERSPQNRTPKGQTASLHRVLGMAALCAVCAVAVVPLAYRVDTRSQELAANALPALAIGVSGWRGPLAVNGKWKPAFRHADPQLAGTYWQGERQVVVHVAYYSRRRGGSEAVAWGNSLVDGKVWHVAGSERRVIKGDGGVRLRVIESRIFSPRHGRWLVWQWYDVGGYHTDSPVFEKMLEAWATLSGKAAGTSIVTLASPYEGTPGPARRILSDYVKTNFSSLRRCLSGAHQKTSDCGT